MAPSLLLFAGAKIGVSCHSCKFLRIFLVKIARVSEICSIFAPANRDLAQLVAHYVRDVGVAGSSPVIPTKRLRAGCFQPLFLFLAVPFALFGGFAGCGLLFGRRTLPCRLAAGRRAKDRKLQPEKPLIAQ